ncbi:CGNR zinc finger domain-containing protein [Arthrobacter sp. efr-133-TYG-118]|uniref:CGNR zinc finger domain-containing protein n=1 Tax=Arthrobacter sp. efr-133-TYG-118 TaxID=3040279 RepID=UPI00254FB4A5|nr:CGNR zinc finger domain-containing protein [Arthrobacter sp. efr-133-TYG-118]
MVFTSETAEALEAAIALANSALKPDALTTVQAYMDFCQRIGCTAKLMGTRAELEAVRAIRPRLHELLSAERDDAVDLVNGILAEVRAHPRLVRNDALDWHIRAVADDDSMASRILVGTAMATIDLILADEMGRMGVCNAMDCARLFLDSSRNRSRRYCSTACANRADVAAYRARRGPRPLKDGAP